MGDISLCVRQEISMGSFLTAPWFLFIISPQRHYPYSLFFIFFSPRNYHTTDQKERKKKPKKKIDQKA